MASKLEQQYTEAVQTLATPHNAAERAEAKHAKLIAVRAMFAQAAEPHRDDHRGDDAVVRARRARRNAVKQFIQDTAAWAAAKFPAQATEFNPQGA